MNKNVQEFTYGADSNYKNVVDHFYDEEYAIYKLNDSLDEALGYMNDMEDNYGIETHDNISIIVNGIAHEFILGGPQAQGVCDFMRNICNENGYELPWHESIKETRVSNDDLVYEILKDMKQDAHQPMSNIIMWAVEGLIAAMDKSAGFGPYDEMDAKCLKALETAQKELEKINR